VLVAECIDIKRECYFAIVMDRASGGPMMIASQKGGMNIEDVAKEDPSAIFTEPIDIMTVRRLSSGHCCCFCCRRRRRRRRNKSRLLRVCPWSSCLIDKLWGEK